MAAALAIVVAFTRAAGARAPAPRPGTALASSTSRRPASQTTRFAIVIGNNRPEPGSSAPVLRYADDDAIATHHLLREAAVRSILLVRPDASTEEISGRIAHAAPTRAALLRAFEQLRQEMRLAVQRHRRSELLLFYSGHGDAEHGEGYVLLEDGRLTRTELHEWLLARSPAAQNHVIIDACKSSLLALSRGPGGRRRSYPRSFVQTGVARNIAHTGYVLSTASARDSHEWEQYHGGVFSHEIRSALRGAADVNADGTITYGELGAFLETTNRAIRHRRLRPDFALIPPGQPPGDLSRPLFSWNGRQASLLLDTGQSGHVFVETEDGERVLDVHPAKDAVARLYLPEDRPLFLRDRDGLTEFTIEKAETTRISQLSAQRTTIARRGALHVAFLRLFALPFGSAELTAYAAAHARRSVTAVTRPQAHVARQRAVNPGATVRSVAGWTTLVAAPLAVGAHLWSYERQSAAEPASQQDRVGLNRTIDTLRITAITLYALAGAAGLTWVALSLYQRSGTQGGRFALRPTIAHETTGLQLGLSGEWDDGP